MSHQISNEIICNLSVEDVNIESYRIDIHYAEAKLQCGFYVYWTGHNNEVYQENKYLFAGHVNNLLISTQRFRNISENDERLIFNRNYLNYCHEMMELNESDEKYLKLIEIAKNIIRVSNAKILFYELESYAKEILDESRLNLLNTLNSYRDTINDAIRKAKEEQSEEPKHFSTEELEQFILDHIDEE